MPDLVGFDGQILGVDYPWTGNIITTHVTYGSTSLTNTTISNTISNNIITAITAGTMNHDEWQKWNEVYTLTIMAGTAGSCSNTLVAAGWPFSATAYSATTAVNQITWGIWNDRMERIQAAGGRAAEIQRYSRRKLTEAELLAALEEEKKAREAAEKRAAEARAAEKRAEELLHLCLTPQQIDDLGKKNCFYVEVEGRGGKKERYRIDRGSHGNVKQIDDKGSIIRQFCIQPSGVPNGDVLLTQKLWLEASEETREEFWATANITTLMREKEIPPSVPRKERRRYAEVHGLLH
jgi:hypothetical protein